MNSQEDELDLVLADHLRRRLDPQLGRAGAAFEAGTSPPRGATRRRAMALVFAAAAGGLIAAAIAVAWTILPRTEDASPPSPVVIHPSVPATSDAGPREIERLVMWRTVDEGAAVVGDRLPVRKLRQEAVEQVQYYDPRDRATIRLTVPLVRDVMVQMETY